MSEKPWFAEKSFPVIVFIGPLVTLYGGFLVWAPKEVLAARPTLGQFAIGIIGAVVAWLLLVMAFTLIWALFMRLLYGSPRVREWIVMDKTDDGRLGNSLERVMRKICELASR